MLWLLHPHLNRPLLPLRKFPDLFSGTEPRQHPSSSPRSSRRRQEPRPPSVRNSGRGSASRSRPCRRGSRHSPAAAPSSAAVSPAASRHALTCRPTATATATTSSAGSTSQPGSSASLCTDLSTFMLICSPSGRVTETARDSSGQELDVTVRITPTLATVRTTRPCSGDMNQQFTQSGTRTPQIASQRARRSRFYSLQQRGARLARRLAVQQLIDWDLPYERAEQIVAELANNAVQHAHIPGRNFRLTLQLTPPGTLRIEVTDTRADGLPRPTNPCPPLAESGRGLLLIQACQTAGAQNPAPRQKKTVWAELTF